MTLRAIDPSPFLQRIPRGPKPDAGDRPELQWLKIAKLRIDPRYQREIGRRGADNIVAIVPQFKWAKFTPVVVAPIGEGLFAVIDGQHRTTAAATPAPAAAKLPPAPAAAPAAPVPAARTALRGALTIGPAEVSRDGRRLRIAPRASLLLQALDKAKPNCVGDEWLIQKLWSIKRPPNAVELIDQLIRDLDGLKALGFEIRSHRGVGRQLVEVEPA